MKLAKTILRRTIWLGRGTATVMGLAVLLALTVGLASTALAGTGVGARFDLGKINTVNKAMTQLVGSVAGPMLSVTNEHPGERVCVDPSEPSAALAPGGPPTSPGPTPPQQCSTKPAPALGLTVQPGQNPVTVNPEAGTATNLSADELDGRSSSSFATATNGKANDANLLDGKDSTAFFSGKTYNKLGNFVNNSGSIRTASATCDPGDVALSGGYQLDPFRGEVRVISEKTEGDTHDVDFVANNSVMANVTCADFPPLR